MTMLPADCAAVTAVPGTPSPSALEKFLRVLSVVTMLMTVPQVLTVWVGRDAGGVSLLSWGAYLFSACRTSKPLSASFVGSPPYRRTHCRRI